MLESIERMVEAEAKAAGAQVDPVVEFYDHFPMTVNTVADTERVMASLGTHGLPVVPLTNPLTGSEDFGQLGHAAGCPSVFWFVGGLGVDMFRPEDEQAMLTEGTMPARLPSNHSSRFAPNPALTLPTAIKAMVTAARAELGAAVSPESL